MRSKFEKRTATILFDWNIPYKYEETSYEYDEPLRKNRARCGDCESTNLIRTGWYTPDFFLDNGVIIECKGRWTAADRRKMLAVEDAHGLGIKMLFMRDNKIHRNSSTYYSDYCMDNNIDYAVGVPPRSWLG